MTETSVGPLGKIVGNRDCPSVSTVPSRLSLEKDVNFKFRVKF